MGETRNSKYNSAGR